MERIKKIKELLNNKGVLLVRTDESGQWFIHCWILDGTVTTKVQSSGIVTKHDGRTIFKECVDDVDKALDEVMNLLVK